MNFGKINILVIEDNAGDARLVNIYLKEAGIKHEFHHAETMFDGAKIAETNPISLVILDLHLPDSAPIQTLNNFVEKFPKLPIVVMTGSKDDAFVERALKAGAQDYLIKGEFSSRLLSRVIRYSLQRHKRQQRLKQTERQLQIAQARYQEAEKMAGFGKWEVDIVTNEMTWTDQVYKIFGFQPNMLTPSLGDYLHYIHHDDREVASNSFEEAIKDGLLHKIEYRIVIEGRRLKYIANQFQISFDEYTGRTLLVGALQDITEQKLSQQLLEEKKITDQTSKVKEELLEDLSFQIRTPLSSIVNLSYVLDDANLDASDRDNLGALRSSVDDLGISINNLLNFSLLVSEKIKVEENQFRLDELITNLRRLVQVKADNKSIKLDFELQSDSLPPYIGDQNKINQILYNLLDNAIKYTQDRGIVKLSLKVLEDGDDSSEIKFLVKDNGKGMPSAKVKELLKAEVLGNVEEESNERPGLGIPIASRLAETMGGSLDISSVEGKGSSFEILLPLKKATITRQSVGEKPIHPVKILFVEDHFLNQISTSNVLKKWSKQITVDIADNGKVGVDKFEADPTYDLILMDLQMPIMNGFEAAEEIRKRSDIPIIALSANTNKAEADKCLASGMNDYIAKPFQPKDLFSAIMNLLYFREEVKV